MIALMPLDPSQSHRSFGVKIETVLRVGQVTLPRQTGVHDLAALVPWDRRIARGAQIVRLRRAGVQLWTAASLFPKCWPPGRRPSWGRGAECTISAAAIAATAAASVDTKTWCMTVS
jgi:hypothetical protein